MSKLKKVKDVLDALGNTKAGQKVTKKVKEAGEFVGIGDKRKKNVKAGVSRVKKAQGSGRQKGRAFCCSGGRWLGGTWGG